MTSFSPWIEFAVATRKSTFTPPRPARNRPSWALRFSEMSIWARDLMAVTMRRPSSSESSKRSCMMPSSRKRTRYRSGPGSTWMSLARCSKAVSRMSLARSRPEDKSPFFLSLMAFWSSSKNSMPRAVLRAGAAGAAFFRFRNIPVRVFHGAQLTSFLGRKGIPQGIARIGGNQRWAGGSRCSSMFLARHPAASANSAPIGGYRSRSQSGGTGRRWRRPLSIADARVSPFPESW